MKTNIEKIQSLNAKPYIPVSAVVYRLDESQYRYNKDADEWICSQDNRTVKKKRLKLKISKEELVTEKAINTTFN